jgi:hypothetical protein
MEMPMTDAELHARAIIAAALMQAHVVDLSGVSFQTAHAQATPYPSLVKLRTAVDVVFDAISK